MQTRTCCTHDCNESRDCVDTRTTNWRTLRAVAGWLAFVMVMALAFAAVTAGRAGIPREYTGHALALAVSLAALFGGVGGFILSGWLNARVTTDESEAGDTLAAFVDLQPQETRRVRAGSAPLPYSYDARKRSGAA